MTSLCVYRSAVIVCVTWLAGCASQVLDKPPEVVGQSSALEDDEIPEVVVTARRERDVSWGGGGSVFGGNGGGSEFGGRQPSDGTGEVTEVANVPAPVLTLELIHKIMNALHIAEIAEGLVSNTLTWGLTDVNYFRNGDGSHVPNPQGSLIPWQTAQVNWNEYGAADPSLSDQQVFNNFLQAFQ